MYYWQIDDGRVYGAAEADFVDGEAICGQIVALYADTSDTENLVVADAAFLRETVLFYGFPLAEVLKTDEDRRADILARLDAVDTATIRPQRSISTGKGTPEDQAKLAALEAEAEALRAELAALGLTGGEA